MGRRELAVYDGVEDGGAEFAVDRASGESEAGCVGEKGVGGRELDEGDEEGKGSDWPMPERMLKPIWAWFMLEVVVQ